LAESLSVMLMDLQHSRYPVELRSSLWPENYSK